MHFRLRHSLLLLVGLSLGACGADVSRMAMIPPIAGGIPAQFKDAIRIGPVTGGATALNGVGASDFKAVLENVLRANGALAPSRAAAHYTLDASVSFNEGHNGLFNSQRIEATASYRLRESAQAGLLLDRTIKTTFIQRPPPAGLQVATFAFGGFGAVVGDQSRRETYAYEGAVRENVEQFLYALGNFGAPGEKSRDAAPATPGAPPEALVGEAPPLPASQPTARQDAAAKPASASSSVAPQPQIRESATTPLTRSPSEADRSSTATPAQLAALPPTRSQATAETVKAPAAPPQRFGDEVQFRCPAPGTEIDFRSGLTRVFAPPVEASGPDCAYDQKSGMGEATAFGVYTGGAARHALRRLWPLRVGKEVSFSSEGSIGRIYSERYRVVRHELVTVPAGTFDAFVIEWESTSADQYANGYHETATFWYAPALGYVVKVEHHMLGGLYARLSDDEAVRVVSR